MSGRWVKLYEKIKDWEWYKNGPTKDLFMHLLIRANYKDSRWNGIIVKKGSLVTSVRKLSEETGLSVSQIRNALDHLKATHEITIQTTSRYTVISICNYGIYQGANDKNDTRNSKQKSNSNRNTRTNKEKEKNIATEQTEPPEEERELTDEEWEATFYENDEES